MSRGVPSAVAVAPDWKTVFPFFAVDVMLDSPNEMHFWTGVGEITHDGTAYVGAGELMQISDVQESSDFSAKGATITLSGIPADLLDMAMNEDYQGRKCHIKFGVTQSGVSSGSVLLTDDGSLITAPGDFIDISADSNVQMFDLFVGDLDVMTVEDGAETAMIAVSVESAAIDFERVRLRRYTHEDQQLRFPGDGAFQFVSRIQDEQDEW